MTNTNNCVIDDCHARYITQWTIINEQDMDYTTDKTTAEYGICIKGNNNTVRRSSVEHSAMSGFKVYGDGNLIDDCIVSNCNTVGSYEGGILLGADQTGHNVASHNSIYNMGHEGISFSASALATTATSQKFLYNDVYNCQMLCNDGGTFYFCCGDNG